MVIPQGDKTEKATPKRRQDERKKGNIFQSHDITNALGLLAIFGSLSVMGSYLFQYTAKVLTDGLTALAHASAMSRAGVQEQLTGLVLNMLVLSLPVMLVAAIAGVAMDLLQTRFGFTMSRLHPNFRALNPLSGLKRMFSMRSFVELLKSVLKVVIVTYVAYGEISADMPEFMRLYDKGIGDALSWIAGKIVYIGLKVGVVMAVLGILDYLYQWWEYERQIMMTKQEIKDEYKQTEGDPQIKGRIRDIQRRMAMARMMQRVPSADVVIRNPTHFAVAIRYDEKKNKAPVVVAKGRDAVALRIVRTAEENNVVVTENPPLARGLYAAVELDREIPPEYYQAVAEVLAFVYNLKRGKRRR